MKNSVLSGGTGRKVPLSLLNAVTINPVDDVTGRLTGEFIEVLHLEESASHFLQQQVDSLIELIGDVESKRANLVVLPSGESCVRLPADPEGFQAVLNQFERDISAKLGNDKTRLVMHYINLYFRKSGAQMMEIAFAQYEENGGYMLDYSYYSTDGSLDYSYEAAQVRQLSFSGFRRWQHLNAVLHR